MKSIPAALAEMLPAYTPRGAVRVGLHDAQDRILAGPVLARVDLPPFDNSAMDGYAVRAAELAGASPTAPVALTVQGESRAGGQPPAPLDPGSAMRIFTGAPLPAGADTVVMQEDTERDGETVRIMIDPQQGRHVRARAGDLAAGTVCLERGTSLGPGELGLLAAQRHAQVSVVRRPRVAILSTGDELRDVSGPHDPGTIVNSNAYALAAQVREAGGEPWVLPIIPDDLEAIVAAVEEGLRADLLISIGGVSVGEYDFVRTACERAGVTLSFWKVAIKPGKPLSFGLKGDVPVVGLPGNPVSAMVTFEVFVRPGIRAMLADPAPYRAAAQVRLGRAHTHKTGRTELVRATLQRGPDGLTVELHRRQGSGSLTSMVGVDALVVLPADQASFAEGEQLTALLLHERRGVAESPWGPVGG